MVRWWPFENRSQPASPSRLRVQRHRQRRAARDLREALGGGVRVESTEAPGVAPNRVEALAFAWLGYRFMRRQPGTCQR